MYKKLGGRIKTFDELKSDVSFTVSKNKVAIYSAEEKPFVIMIESKNISQAPKIYFDQLWKYAEWKFLRGMIEENLARAP